MMKEGDYISYDGMSDCCGSPVYGESDICSKCKEHCTPMTEDEFDSEFEKERLDKIDKILE